MTQPKDKLDTQTCKDTVEMYGLLLAGYKVVNEQYAQISETPKHEHSVGMGTSTTRPSPSAGRKKEDKIAENGLKIGRAFLEQECGATPEEVSAHFRAKQPAPPKP